MAITSKGLVAREEMMSTEVTPEGTGESQTEKAEAGEVTGGLPTGQFAGDVPPPARSVRPSGGRRWRRWVAMALAVVVAGGAVGTALALTGGRSKARSVIGIGAPRTPSPTGYSSFQSMYAGVGPSIARIATIGCDGSSGSGSGFAVDAHHIVTAAHVVEGSQQMTVTIAGSPVPVQVTGLDQSGDVALLHTDASVASPYLPLAQTDPAVGERVAALGFPLGGGLTMTQGSVSALNQTESVDNVGQLAGLVQTDAALNPGNSGGPLVGLNGKAQGIVDAGNTQANAVGYAISPRYAVSEVADWIAAPQSHPLPLCSTSPSQGAVSRPATPQPATGSPIPAQPAPSTSPSSPPAYVQIQGANNAPPGIVTALTTYFNAINNGDYALAYAQLGPDKQKTISESNFAAGDATSQDTNIAVGAVNPTSKGSYLVDVSFTSQQSPNYGPNGDQCDNWTLRYTMINSGGSWLIDGTSGQYGVTHRSCG